MKNFQIDLSNPNPSTRFYFDEDDKKGPYVDLRICAGKDAEKINKLTVKKRVEFKKGQRFEVEDVDTKKRNHLLWDFMIEGWGKIVDQNKKEIQCTADNKYLLMSESVSFASIVAGFLEVLSEDTKEYKEYEEKN